MKKYQKFLFQKPFCTVIVYMLDNHTDSHAGHNLGVLYYQIICISQHYTSTFKDILLFSLFLSNDRYLNNENAYLLVINEFKDLEDNGILVQTALGEQ